VIVDDLHVKGIAAAPPEHHSPLVVDPYRVQAFPSSFQPLETIARWHRQVFEIGCIVEVEQFATCRPAQIGRKRSGRLGLLVVEEIFGQGIPKGLDHVIMLSEYDNSVKIKLARVEQVFLLNSVVDI